MKKNILTMTGITLMAGAIIMPYGCKKEYTCKCTTTDAVTGAVLGTDSTTVKLKKKTSKSWCDGTPVTVDGKTTTCVQQ